MGTDLFNTDSNHLLLPCDKMFDNSLHPKTVEMLMSKYESLKGVFQSRSHILHC